MDFRAERAAYRAGYGDPREVIASLRAEQLYVPLDDGGELYSLPFAGVRWMPVFTDTDRLRTFLDRTGADVSTTRMTRLDASELLDTFVLDVPTSDHTSTGLAVDPGHDEVMAFTADTVRDAMYENRGDA